MKLRNAWGAFLDYSFVSDSHRNDLQRRSTRNEIGAIGAVAGGFLSNHFNLGPVAAVSASLVGIKITQFAYDLLAK